MTDRHIHTGFLLLRLGLGLLLLARGYQHLFVLGLESTTELWRGLGLPYPLLLAPLLSLLELLAGPLLMLGLATRPMAGLTTAAALGVLIFARWETWRALPSAPEPLQKLLEVLTAAPVEGWWMLLAASLALAVTGAGEYSVDARRLPSSQAAHPLDAVAETGTKGKKRGGRRA